MHVEYRNLFLSGWVWLVKSHPQNENIQLKPLCAITITVSCYLNEKELWRFSFYRFVYVMSPFYFPLPNFRCIAREWREFIFLPQWENEKFFPPSGNRITIVALALIRYATVPQWPQIYENNLYKKKLRSTFIS